MQEDNQRSDGESNGAGDNSPLSSFIGIFHVVSYFDASFHRNDRTHQEEDPVGEAGRTSFPGALTSFMVDARTAHGSLRGSYCCCLYMVP